MLFRSANMALINLIISEYTINEAKIKTMLELQTACIDILQKENKYLRVKCGERWNSDNFISKGGAAGTAYKKTRK